MVSMSRSVSMVCPNSPVAPSFSGSNSAGPSPVGICAVGSAAAMTYIWLSSP